MDLITDIDGMPQKEPYIDFYTGDWIKDQAVSRCSPATRGVWIDLLCAMHDAGRSGKLCGTSDELARLARCSTAELSTALTSLQTTGAADVTERNGIYTVINRRMYRKAQNRDKTRARVAKHRASHNPSNSRVTPKSRGDPSDSDSDLNLSFVFQNLPRVLAVQEFKTAIETWLRYKAERREKYKTQGLKTLISRAAKLADTHGVTAVVDAMEKAIANRWAGWDQESSFKGGKNGRHDIGPGQSFDPNASKLAGVGDM